MDKKLFVLSSIFVTSLLIANIIASKLVDIGGIILPAAVFVFPITFLVTDTISEVWGKEQAKFVVWVGFFMNFLMIIFLQLGQVLPAAAFWEHQQAYQVILGAVPRIFLASISAYLVSQFSDIWIFAGLKSLTKGKHLWLRNNASTITSQLLDSCIFIVIAFWGTMPVGALITMVFSQYLVKAIIALLETPVCYLAVNWAKQHNLLTKVKATN